MTSAPAYEEIRQRALELVESRRIDPVLDRDAARAVVTGAVDEYKGERTSDMDAPSITRAT
jgi:hypothetical protein